MMSVYVCLLFISVYISAPTQVRDPGTLQLTKTPKIMLPGSNFASLISDMRSWQKRLVKFCEHDLNIFEPCLGTSIEPLEFLMKPAGCRVQGQLPLPTFFAGSNRISLPDKRHQLDYAGRPAQSQSRQHGKIMQNMQTPSYCKGKRRQ